MDWLTNFLKHLGISRSVIGAAFITSTVLYVGPRVAPAYVDPVPKEWVPFVFVVLVFSASLLVFWAFAATWEFVRGHWSVVSALIASRALNQTEQQILLAMGQRLSEPLNLAIIDYEAIRKSQLEILELVSSLERKGLASINPYADNLVSLTPMGRQRALELQRSSPENAT